MKPLFFLPFCCVLFVLSGLMTSCGKPTSKQEPAAIPAEPAVEKPAEKPEASAAVAAKKEPAAAPEEPQGEKPAAKPETNAAVAAKEEPAASPAKPQVEKPAEKAEASKPAAASDKAQLEQAVKAIAEAARQKSGQAAEALARARKKEEAAKQAEVARKKAEEVARKKAPKVEAADLPVVEITVNRYEWFEYKTGMSGDEQGVRIKFHPKHCNGGAQAGALRNSKILRDKTTGFEAVYRYRSQPNYVGKDSVELEYSDHELGSGLDDPGTTTITRQVINITVVANAKE